MSHKLTDGNKWDDGWFAELSQVHKLVFIFLIDQCDCAGLWKVNLRQLQFNTGATADEWKSFVKLAGDRRIQFVREDLVWLVKYIPFQHQRGFTPTNKVVIGIARRLGCYSVPIDMLPPHHYAVLFEAIDGNHGDGEGASRVLKGVQENGSPLKGIKEKESEKALVKEKATGKGRGVAIGR